MLIWEKKPRRPRSLNSQRAPTAWDQRPKNSHNRMITGIGTPSSQSRIPRPMVVSLHFNPQ
jgi:hypothetical protein